MSKDHHADGQKDAAAGEFNPPHGEVEGFFSFGKDAEDIREANANYRAGQDNHNNQK